MGNTGEHILVVESNPEISSLVGEQTLGQLGYQVTVLSSAAEAAQTAASLTPDLVIADLELPELSGKDLLVALSSQGVAAPVIVIAQKGMENRVIQAFRLGASDYLAWPFREAELVAAVERALVQVRARREREKLSDQLKKANEALESRLRELTAIYSIGKAVVSITDQRQLFEKILEGAAYITQADMGWILLRSEAGKTLSLAASRNLPAGLAAYTQKPWEDGLSPLVALSGESLAIHGDPIKRFPIARLGLSALIAPIKAKQEVIGILAMMRKADQAFIRTHQNLLEAMADYASVSLVNARLFQILEQRVRVLQQMADSAQLEAQLRAGRLQQSAESLRQPLEQSQAALDSLGGETAGLSGEAQAAVNTARAGLGAVSELLALTPAPRLPEASKGPQRFDLAAAARQAQARLADIARRREVHLVCQAPESGLYTSGSPAQVGDILDTLLLYAIRCSLPAGQVLLHVDAAPAGGLRVVIQDAGPAIEQAEAALMLSRIDAPAGQAALASGRPWIGLKLIRQAIERHGGRFSLLSATGKGVIVQFSMLRIRTLA